MSTIKAQFSYFALDSRRKSSKIGGVSSIAKTAFAGSFALLSLKSLKPLNFLDKVELSFP